MNRFEVSLKFLHVLREAFSAGESIAAQRLCGRHVGPGRTTQAKIDTIRIERGQRPELLGNDEWRMVGQHYAA